MHEWGWGGLKKPCDKDKKETYSGAQAVKLVVLYPQLPDMLPWVLYRLKHSSSPFPDSARDDHHPPKVS